MTAKGKQWAERDLRVTEVRERPEFQLRAGGLDRAYVKRLGRVLDSGGDLPAIKVAEVGRAFYLVDGFHRLEAHRRVGRGTIRVAVARMGLEAAKEEVRLANTRHGKPLSRADKGRLWADFVSEGLHRGTGGALKSPRAIEAELNHVISRETIRQRLKAMGLEDELEPAKAWGGGSVDEETLAAELAEEADTLLRLFGEMVLTLPLSGRAAAVEAARKLLDALERSEVPMTVLEAAVDDVEALGI